MQRLEKACILGELFACPYVPARRVAGRCMAEPIHRKRTAPRILRNTDFHAATRKQRDCAESRTYSRLGGINRDVHCYALPFRVKCPERKPK
jgi:hypothetical protein